MKVQLDVDLTPITRLREGSDKALTLVYLEVDYKPKLWFKCGEVNIHPKPNGDYGFSARLPYGVTDVEHDGAYAFNIPIIAVNFEFVSNGHVKLDAYIKPPQDQYGWEDFHFPKKLIDLESAEMCSYCEEPHPIVDYLPKANTELYRKLQGKKITIYLEP